jgi:hypothetical protein
MANQVCKGSPKVFGDRLRNDRTATVHLIYEHIQRAGAEIPSGQ